MSRDFKSVFLDLFESGETFGLDTPIIPIELEEEPIDSIEISDEVEKEIDVSISLLEKGNLDLLTPLAIDNKKKSDTEKENAHFEIEIEDSASEKTTIEVKNGSTTLYKEIHTTKYVALGKHNWIWDGYDSNGILDTKILKSPELKVIVSVVNKYDSASDTADLDNEEEEVDWVDVKVNRKAMTIDVELRLNLDNGDAEELDDPLPAGLPVVPGAPASGTKPSQLRSFNKLKEMVLQGVSKYWSRDVTTPKGKYKVTTKAIQTTSKHMDDLDVNYNTNDSVSRSSNPGSVRDIVSFFANVVPEEITYNVEWNQFVNKKGKKFWAYIPPSYADKEFLVTAAHEIGHEILSAFASPNYSYTHKGSSTLLTQTPLLVADGGSTYAPAGEIDLMKYFDSKATPRPANFHTRVIAAEDDVLGLIWLSRVDFDE
ncbi:hypothetical protein RQM59_05205 [Flavobacteriaceae bacterium S356]|uniref:Peptidase M10 metallopeptidase domain-containing protein n=1 Tax=Asprobacillus argus TaxID=3076534 RepID=A0ABU3LEP8_9FLAO|nr:hypothetical protein [Flavobacteriaceae bacterium S356]